VQSQDYCTCSMMNLLISFKLLFHNTNIGDIPLYIYATMFRTCECRYAFSPYLFLMIFLHNFSIDSSSISNITSHTTPQHHCRFHYITKITIDNACPIVKVWKPIEMCRYMCSDPVRVANNVSKYE